MDLKAADRMPEKAKKISGKVREMILSESGIVFAFLFGSYAEGRETVLSDIDLALYFHGMTQEEKIDLEHRLWLSFDEPVNVVRLEDDDISPLVRLRALEGVPIIIKNQELLNRFTLSIIHRAVEAEVIIGRLRRIT